MSNYEEVARLNAMYSDLEHREGWKDYMARLRKMRETIIQELCVGLQDDHGNTRDREKRALLYGIEKLLSVPKVVREQYDSLTKKKESVERRAERKGGLHGVDHLSYPQSST